MQIPKLLLCISLLFLISGCWDSIEIEELGFLLGVGLDPLNAEEQEEGALGLTDMNVKEHDQQHLFRTTYQIAVPKNLQIGEGNDSDAFTNITATGMTSLKMNRNTSTRTSRINNAEHLQTIVINAQLARKGMLEHLVDVYLRDHEMRRRVHILISQGSAKAILEKNFDQEQMPSITMRKINKNYAGALQTMKFVEIGELTSKLIRSESYILPRIAPHGDMDFKIAGAAIFDGRNNKMVDWLNQTDIEGYNWITGDAENGVLEVELEDNASFVFETFHMSSKRSYQKKEDKDHFDLNIRVEGTFSESWLHHININSDTLDQIERKIEEKIKDQASSLLDKMQNKYHLDVFGFGQIIKRKNYSYWQKIKENWDGEQGGFQQADFDIKVKAKIRNYMTEQKLD